MMKTRDEIITDMCYAWRHDYGLDKWPDEFSFRSGMTPAERTILWNQMARLFDDNISPFMEFNQE